jgi:methyl-accepting chemotaxis protein
MEVRSADIESLTLQPLMRFELVVASLLPAAAILFVGVIGSRMITPTNVGPFVMVFLFFALAIFGGEFALISMMQRAMKGQLSDFTTVCQAFLAGNKEKRATVRGDQELTATLALALNSLLDFVVQQENQHASQKGVSEKSEELLKGQLKQLAHKIAPVMDGDLREKAEIATGDIGIVIDSCNYLITQLVQQIKWTRRASEQVINVTREMLDHSIEFAQSSETQLLLLARTTETQEKLGAFMQRLSSTLQLCLDLAHDRQIRSEQRDEPVTDSTAPRLPRIVDSTLAKDSHLKRPEVDIQQQAQLLTEALDTVREYTAIAEYMIEDLHTLAQHIHRSGATVLSIAERTNSLVPLAERWRNSIAAFYLPGEGDQQYQKD